MAIAIQKAPAEDLAPDAVGFAPQPIVVLGREPERGSLLLRPVPDLDPHRRSDTQTRCHGGCWQSLRLFGHPRHHAGFRPDHDHLTGSAGPTTCPSCGGPHARTGGTTLALVASSPV
jgi:hypothetical protein